MAVSSARVAIVLGAILLIAALAHSASTDPFGFLAPDLVVTAADRARLDAGQTIVRVLPGRDGFLSLSAIVRINATAERVEAWAVNVEALQKGHYVPEIGVFSPTPRLEDLAGLTIDKAELEDLAECRPGDCALKLSDAEIDAVRGRDHAAIETMFRRFLVQRATDYLTRGAVCAYHDRKAAVDPAQVFGMLVGRLQFFPRTLRCYAEYLQEYPARPDPHVRRSFLYWSKEDLGMKPIVSITHFSAARFDTAGLPELVVVAKQVYATHYKNASMTFTALVRDRSAGRASHADAPSGKTGPPATSRTEIPPTDGSTYLVYVNRSHIDSFHGVFGGMVRRIVEHRVKSEAPRVLQGLRRKLESGEPPGRVR